MLKKNVEADQIRELLQHNGLAGDQNTTNINCSKGIFSALSIKKHAKKGTNLLILACGISITGLFV